MSDVRAATRRCSCHSDRTLYDSLERCVACGHWSYDPGVGCERRACGSTSQPYEQQALG